MSRVRTDTMWSLPIIARDVWGKVAQRMHRKLMQWSRVRLSFKGRVMVLKSMAYSQIWYLGSIYTVEKFNTLDLDKMCFRFPWDQN